MMFLSDVGSIVRWIDEIKECTGETDTGVVVKFALSVALQVVRHGDIGMYRWGGGDC